MTIYMYKNFQWRLFKITYNKLAIMRIYPLSEFTLSHLNDPVNYLFTWEYVLNIFVSLNDHMIKTIEIINSFIK